jgi:hypothetical protein
METVMLCFFYLDPASGSMIYQIALAGLLSISAIWRKPWIWLAARFHGKRKGGESGI